MPVTAKVGDNLLPIRSKSYAGLNQNYSSIPQTVSEEDTPDGGGSGVSLVLSEPSFEEVESSFSRNISFGQSFRNSKLNSNVLKSKSTLDVSNNVPVIQRRGNASGLKLNINVETKKKLPSRSSTTSPADFLGGSESGYKKAMRKVGVFSKNVKSPPVIKTVEKLSSSSDSEDDDDELENSRGTPSLDAEKLEIPSCPVDHSEGKEVLNEIFPCNVDQMFSMLFVFESKFHQEFHASRKTTGVESTPWENCPVGNGKTKKISMTVVNTASVGPKTAGLTDTMVMLPISKPGAFYLIESESVQHGIPYADSFYIKMHYCLSRISTNQCKLVIVAQIKYKKSVMWIAKSFIEKHGIAGIEKFHGSLKKALADSCAKSNSSLSMAKTFSKSQPVGESSKKRDAHLRKGARSKRRAPIPGSRNESGNSAQENVQSFMNSKKSLALKGIGFSLLLFLVFLNIYFHLKINELEMSLAADVINFSAQNMPSEKFPKNPEDWISLMETQEELQQTKSLQWKEILLTALDIIQKAESNLETLKFSISPEAVKIIKWS